MWHIPDNWSLQFPVEYIIKSTISCEKTWVQIQFTSIFLPSEKLPGFQWSHNDHDGISNHLRLYCLLNHMFKRRSKKTSKLHITGLWEGKSLVTCEFPAQRASNAENVSIWWRHHGKKLRCGASTFQHIGLVSLCMSKLGHHWFRQWLVTCLVSVIFWTNRGWDKFAAISQMTISNAFSWMIEWKCMNFAYDNIS